MHPLTQLRIARAPGFRVALMATLASVFAQRENLQARAEDCEMKVIHHFETIAGPILGPPRLYQEPVESLGASLRAVAQTSTGR